MKTILLIIKREYLVRVRKRSFVIMTLLTPLLMTSFWLIPAYLAMRPVEVKKVQVIDESGLFKSSFKNTDELTFTFANEPLAKAKAGFAKSGYDVLAYIPKTILERPKDLKLYAEKNVSLGVKSGVEKAVENELENIKLVRAGISRQALADTKVDVSADTYSLSDGGEKDSSSGAATGIGYIGALLIYFAIFLYGAQVMRGVVEEKTNRIVEVIISSVKPFQLMMGKIIGVAFVGLTQFLLWILLTIGVSTATSALLGRTVGPQQRMASLAQPTNSAADAQLTTSDATSAKATAQPKAARAPGGNFVTQALKAVSTLNIPLILTCFLIYFAGGYLVYSALFAAIGAAVDNETDTQQFMLPVTIPLILSVFLAQFVIREPDGPLAFWASIIPLTSPIVMMVRVPFGVPTWELVLSVALLIAGFLATTWLAARIYRVGILMYGKKVSYRELSKWLFYKG